ncbi:ComF family protein [Candidatus Poribacteria bacterium]|jgi:ComF family protein|nr:ComF family protein [Candidatus Poribacteria bacterium]MBT5536934.1 ComF family protein [Candidatus Poribacteria bacterium]MBT5714718.1 ComF family protein [Candidatus Poribacteria bacterium]MBT7096370.1 ComF family protein [Candidatus Poribacteria bacterium]MBT7805657.1 ComF family protein [Candidatus Poribacteria bacterium]
MWDRRQDATLDGEAPMEARAATRYSGATRDAILAMKGEARLGLCRRLADLIADISPALYDWDEYAALIPIPSHRVRRAERGFSQTELLAKRLSRRVGLPVQTRWLRRVKATRPLRLLEGRHERSAEVRDAFRCRAIPKERHGSAALLLDDIVTTGATTMEARSALIDAGLGRVDVICVARALGSPDGSFDDTDDAART